AFATYIMTRRRQIHYSWLFMWAAAGIAGFASSIWLADTASTLFKLDPSFHVVFFTVAFGMCGASILPMRRLVRYWWQLDRFSYEITELLAEDKRRRERLEKMKTPAEFEKALSKHSA